ncbi:uncharacterized protein PAC_19302 [Phialocephala subalpina]|uniref:FAD-binding PCMH-type domain-containing protein n=1 Tax=Phialocephala subalpina TaxID=576137 RepID=A0A1L7XWG5_9HELO|nr:uncharacterized protein PAC_19302 [Phialocephala subalpina]
MRVLEPTCVFSPASVTDILITLNKLEDTPCKFAVRSGGQGPFAGSSNIQDGVLIDLVSINEITFSADRNSLVLGSGQIWNVVYATLDKQDLVVIGTHTGDVSVSGSLLGGAMSSQSNLHGWGCDNVLSHEIVSLRGGGGNFGIVTRFTVKTYRQDLIWGGGIVFEMAQLATLIDGIVNFTNQGVLDPKAHMALAFVYYKGPYKDWKPFMEYVEPIINPPIFHNFTSLPSVTNTMKIDIFGNNSAASVANDVWGLQETFWTFTYRNDPVLPHLIWVQCQDGVNAFLTVHQVAGFTVACIFAPMSIPMIQQGLKNGGNAMGISAETPLMLFLFQLTWNDAADEEVVLNLAQSLIAQTNDTAHSMDINYPYIHLNHAATQQNPPWGYGEGNLEKLRVTSAKYDPKVSSEI